MAPAATDAAVLGGDRDPQVEELDDERNGWEACRPLASFHRERITIVALSPVRTSGL